MKSDANGTGRLWAISDLHIDFPENKQQLLALDNRRFLQDALIVAGDVTDDIARLLALLEALRRKFSAVAFVPGNHELWIRDHAFPDSLSKFDALMSACERIGIHTRAFRFGEQDDGIWIVPLLSWYAGAEESGSTLYVKKQQGVEDRTEEMWADYYFTKWPSGLGVSIADYFLDMNLSRVEQPYDAPVVTFSHFLPRRELIFRKHGESPVVRPRYRDEQPAFNFSKVAGTQRLDRQLRRISSRVHVYGHQHRNRVRHIDGVTYVSHCMGYPRERTGGYLLDSARHPKLIWQSSTGFVV